jgi:hypothetical protein
VERGLEYHCRLPGTSGRLFFLCCNAFATLAFRLAVPNDGCWRHLWWILNAFPARSKCAAIAVTLSGGMVIALWLKLQPCTLHFPSKCIRRQAPLLPTFTLSIETDGDGAPSRSLNFSVGKSVSRGKITLDSPWCSWARWGPSVAPAALAGGNSAEATPPPRGTVTFFGWSCALKQLVYWARSWDLAGPRFQHQSTDGET